MLASKPTKSKSSTVSTAAAKPSASTRGVYAEGGLGEV
jgi:hypothetical protein